MDSDNLIDESLGRQKLHRELIEWFLLRWKVCEQKHQKKIRLIAEYPFADGRRWRFDFAIPEIRVAIECHGGIFRKQQGGHSNSFGLLRDYKKTTAAIFAGEWLIFPIAGSRTSKDPSLQELLSLANIERIYLFCAKKLERVRAFQDELAQS